MYGDLSAGLNDYTGTRRIAFPGVDRSARAKYSGQDYTAFATTGYDFVTNGMTVTPLASLQYTHANLGGYTESGAGSVNLTTRSQSYDFLESGLGVKVSRAFVHRDLSFVPEVHAKWLHELANPVARQTSAFTAATGASFTTRGLKTANDTGNLGAGLTILSCTCSARTWSLEAVYDYFQRSDHYAAHQGMLKFSSRF
ncbi:MAG: autotransporter outer membrane beta-barrel domain-containing protein [Rhodospirillales bacterium]|nr:autotransporter outer membrane beta-barrel domain-containing protein [Rhodospirillales bacterium]